jgi:Predicted transcriptional regulators
MPGYRLIDIPSGPFTRAKVARFADLSDDVLAHWTKEGLLQPINDASGTGRHKEFDQLEVHKASALKQMRGFGCNIDALRWFASIVDRGRMIAEESTHFPLHRIWELGSILSSYNYFLEGKHIAIPESIDGEFVEVPARGLEDIAQYQLRGGEEKVNQEELADAIRIVMKYRSKLDYQAMKVGPSFSANYIVDPRVNAILLIWPTPNGWELYEDSDANMSGLRNPPVAGIMIYITRVLRNLWSIHERLI